MGHRSRQQLSAEFLAETAQSYSPEFKASMLAVMAHSVTCLTERVNTAARYFSWGNASGYAVSDWDPARRRRLDQTDIALILACLESGMKIGEVTDDVIGPMRGDKSLRPKCVKSKHEMSRAFRRNEARGTIRCEGHRIFSDPVPVPQENRKLRIRATFDKDEEYLSTLDPAVLEEWQRRREELAAIERDLRTGFREYRKLRNDTTFDPPAAEPEVVPERDSGAHDSATCAAPILIDEEDCLKRSLSSSSCQNEPTTTEERHAPDPPAARPETPSPERSVANDPPNGRTADRASVRPSDRTERKRAVSRPHQPHTNNGGDPRDVGPRASDNAADDQQNTAVLCDEAMDQVAAAVQTHLHLAEPPDRKFVRDFVRMAQDRVPECTTDQIVYRIGVCAPSILRRRDIDSPWAYLRTAVIGKLTPDWTPPQPAQSFWWSAPPAEICSVCEDHGFVWKGEGPCPERPLGSAQEAFETGLDAERGAAVFCDCVIGQVMADRYADWKEEQARKSARASTS